MVANNNTNCERVKRKQGLGEKNDNGERLTELSCNHELIIGETYFKLKTIHKATWASPGQRTYNQIDHIAISRKQKSCLLDVRSYRAADIASDHYLVIGQIRMKLVTNKNKNSAQRVKCNVDRIKYPENKRKFKQTLMEKAEGSQVQEEEDNDECWKKVSDCLRKTSEEILGLRKKKKKEQLIPDTWNKIE